MAVVAEERKEQQRVQRELVDLALVETVEK
jgi:hypothetical protein